MAIASLFGAIFGMLPLCGNNLTDFAIRSTISVVIYMW